ncbi:hypothetical protein VTO73DRAFT_8462 [Trametes versicolor]
MVTILELAHALVSELSDIVSEEDIARSNLSGSQSVEELDALLQKARALKSWPTSSHLYRPPAAGTADPTLRPGAYHLEEANLAN